MKIQDLVHENIEEIDYIHIPRKYIGKSILEIGVSKRFFNTHLWDKCQVLLGTYTGLDVMDRVHLDDIRFIEADICTYDFPPGMNFDTILSVHTFEHIDLWEWEQIFTKLKAVLQKDGHIIICLPYKQPGRGHTNFPLCLDIWDTYQQHIVFNITKDMLRYYFPGAKIFSKTTFWFRQDGCSLIWAIGRFVKRIFMGPIWPIRRNLYTIWKK